MADATRSERGFLPFFRRYTKTWIHAVATAGLTAFGTLTFVNRGFAVVAVAVYVVPPLVLYFRGADSGNPTVSNALAERASEDSTETERDTETERRISETSRESDEREPDESEPPAWTHASTPDVGTLFDAAVAGERAYAVGENGVVLRSEGESSDWELALEDGPGANGADLRGVDTTTDAVVWVAGDGGALGRFDAGTARHTDHSAPMDITDTWTALAVIGADGDETILLTNGSGQVLRGRYRDGDLAWETPVKPGSGSSLCAATLVDASVGYLCDTNDGVFETEDGGKSFQRIGIDADGTVTDVAATASERGDGHCYVTADDGVCFRYADGTWTPTRLGDEPLRAVSTTDESAVACGDGVVYERTGGNEWNRTVTPATGTLHGVAVGSSRAVGVGTEGTVVERGGE